MNHVTNVVAFEVHAHMFETWPRVWFFAFWAYRYHPLRLNLPHWNNQSHGLDAVVGDALSKSNSVGSKHEDHWKGGDLDLVEGRYLFHGALETIGNGILL